MSLLKGASIYLISNIVNAAIPFLLLPILTRYLTPSEYGQIAMFQTLLGGVGAFVGLNTVGAANRKFYDKDVNDDILQQFNSSCLHILVASSSIVFICAYTLQDELSEYLSIPKSWVLFAIIISALSFITSLRLGQWQIRSQAKFFGILQVVNSLMNMLLSLLFVITLSFGAQGRIDAQILSGILISLISLTLLYKDKLIKVFSWNFEFIKEALSFGIPLIPHIIGFFLITSIDRFIINKDLGLADAGIYMVAVQLSSAMAIVFDAINKSYVPWLFERLKHNDNQEKKRIVKYTYLYSLLVLIFSGLGFILGPFFIGLVAGDNYSSAGNVIGWLCLGQGFGGLYLMYTNYIFYAKKTHLLSCITIFVGFLNVGLIYILIQYFDLVGAAIAFVVARFIQYILTWMLAYKCVKMPWI